MKIYNVVYENIDGDIHKIEVKSFLHKSKATKYFRQKVQEIKKQYKEVGLEEYCIEQTKEYYEIYLEGRASEDSTTIWISDDETCDESVE